MPCENQVLPLVLFFSECPVRCVTVKKRSAFVVQRSPGVVLFVLKIGQFEATGECVFLLRRALVTAVRRLPSTPPLWMHVAETLMRLPWDNWDSYEVGLLEHPIVTKTAINVVIYLVGDWLSQVRSFAPEQA